MCIVKKVYSVKCVECKEVSYTDNMDTVNTFTVPRGDGTHLHTCPHCATTVYAPLFNLKKKRKKKKK